MTLTSLIFCLILYPIFEAKIKKKYILVISILMHSHLHQL